MNFSDHKNLGNHHLQLCPKVVKHPVYILYIYHLLYHKTVDMFPTQNTSYNSQNEQRLHCWTTAAYYPLKWRVFCQVWTEVLNISRLSNIRPNAAFLQSVPHSALTHYRRFFSCPKTPDCPWGPSSLLLNGGRGFHLGGKGGRGLIFSTRLNLTPSVRMNGTMPVLPHPSPCAFMTWTRKNFNTTQTLYQLNVSHLLGCYAMSIGKYFAEFRSVMEPQSLRSSSQKAEFS